MGFKDKTEGFGAAKTIVCLAILTMMLYLLTSCAYDIANRYYGNKTYPAKQLNEVEIRDSGFPISTRNSRRYETQSCRNRR
jgi:hypothetical protein